MENPPPISSTSTSTTATSNKMDEKPIVSFLGPVSSYCHQAALGVFDTEKYRYRASPGITDVFEDVQNGSAELGIVPFENSTNGAVIFTLELLADRHERYKDILVCGEAYLSVSHYLLGHKPKKSPTTDLDAFDSGACTPTTLSPNPLKPKTKPLYPLKHIKRLISHPQAFGQCESFLGTYMKGVERIDAGSTSRAAEMVKEDLSGGSASISSKLAASVHGVDILAEKIEDREDNKTRFFILRKGPPPSSPAESTTKSKKEEEKKEEEKKEEKSLISFTVDHRKPGALAEVLHCFQVGGINLTSINSRPTRVVPFQYIFFVEFEGSLLRDGWGDGRVQRTLECVRGHAERVRWLGSWDANF